MCEFCGDDRCTLTKQQVLERGPILENNAYGIMRLETEETPQTYMRYVFDEDTSYGGEWECYDVDNPLMFQTEQEFMKKIEAGRDK